MELPMIDAGMVLGTLDLLNKQVVEGMAMQFRCKFTADCCSGLKIPVTDFDIKRIEEHGIALDQIIESSSPILRLPKTSAGSIEKNYWMKRKPFDNTCTFLESNKCSIHEFKPYACRVFPFSFRMIDENRIEVRVHPSNLCKSIEAVDMENSNNRKLLLQLLDVELDEIRYREWYFDRYSDQI